MGEGEGGGERRGRRKDLCVLCLISSHTLNKNTASPVPHVALSNRRFPTLLSSVDHWKPGCWKLREVWPSQSTACTLCRAVSSQPAETGAVLFGRECNIGTIHLREKGKLECLVINCCKV